MFESIIALTSSNIRRINSIKFLKTFSSFNWSSVRVEINCRPHKKNNGTFSLSFDTFNTSPNDMLKCKKRPLESIKIEGRIGDSHLEMTCIFCEDASHWIEAKIESNNKSMVNIIEKQILNIFKLK